MSKKIDKVILYWVRRDFRLEDNSALSECVSICKKRENTYFLPLFILEDYMLEAKTDFQFGLPSRYFLSRAIPKFSSNFSEFLLLKGKGGQSIVELINLIQNFENKIEIEIHVNEDVYADFYKQIEKLEKNAVNNNFTIKVHTDQLTVSKDTVSGTGNKYSVFTPFKKAVWKEFMSAKVLSKVTKSDLEKINYLSKNMFSQLENKLELVEISEEKIWAKFSKNKKFEVINYKTDKKHIFDIDKVLSNNTKDSETNLPENAYADWYSDEESAKIKMKSFIKNLLENYKENRDSLEKDVQESSNQGSHKDLLTGKTSKLSLALAWGLLSARQIKCEMQHHFDEDFLNIDWYDKEISDSRSGILTYLSELIWREFYKYLLYHNPKLMNEEFQEKFKFKVNWVEEDVAVERFTAWMRGETGYKVVDAAMMQLAKTGWMHNRARMIVASVLTKNLGVDWRWGQEYFRAMLIDLDEASNNGGWQWGASVGADPKPIRIFNPYLQAENYDKSNAYQKKWLGEEKFFFGGEPIVPHVVARGEAMKRYGLDKNKDLSLDW